LQFFELVFLPVFAVAEAGGGYNKKDAIRLKKQTRYAACVIICTLLWIFPVAAQESPPSTFRRLNSNAAFNISVPVNQTSQYASTAWGFTYGAGYNFNQQHAVFGEVMWNTLYPTNQALAPIRAMAQYSNINAHGNLVALTANYRLQFEGKTYGTYLVVGGGMYYRQASLSQTVAAGESVTCSPAWLWWGFTCSSGVVTGNQSLASFSSIAPGGNIGIGFTVAIPDSGYRFYIESRYHYAANKGVATQLIPIAIGVRF
jgi:hypothetical protein